MRRIKFFYFIAVLSITVSTLWHFTQTRTDFSSKKFVFKPFEIVEINGDKVFYKNKIIDRNNIQNVDLSSQKKIEKISLYVDNSTSYRFRFNNTFFIACPNTYIKYKSSNLSLLEGEFYWDRALIKKKSLTSKVTSYLPNNQKLLLSKRGRIIVSESEIKIWNYDGKLSIKSSGNLLHLKKGMYVSLKKGKMPQPITFFSKPTVLRPDDNLLIDNPKKTIVQFQWNETFNEKESNERICILKLYSSNTMGKLSESMERNPNGSFLVERKSNASNLAIDFSALIRTNTIYWCLVPYDITTKLEGEPSKIRKLQIADYLLNNAKAQLPPKLQIDPPSISGNIVILSGVADPKSRLFVNGREYEIESNGKFGLNIMYDEGGTYTIVFELISPSDRKNIQKKTIIIY